MPPTRPINTAIDLIKPRPQTCTTMIKAIVTNARSKFLGSPKLLSVAKPPPIFSTATGIKVKPITVMTVPVTKGGNRRLIFEKNPAIRTTKMPEAIIEP